MKFVEERVVRPIAGKDERLAEAEWIFRYFDHLGQFVLTEYVERERPTVRHKMRATTSYSYLGNRHSDLRREDVTIPAEVENAAREQWMDQARTIEFVFWPERKR